MGSGQVLTVGALWIYPVKSCRGFQVDSVHFGHRGPQGDRRYAVVGPAGVFLSQRTHPRMTLIHPRLLPGGGLVLAGPGVRPIEVRPDPQGPRLEAMVWNDRLEAVDCGDAPARWLSELLETPARLAWLPEEGRRVRPGGALRATAFADAEPVLVVTDGSLAAVARETGTAVEAERFRPNLVVSGAPEWAEDHWRIIDVGRARLEIVKPCARCPIVAVDPETGERDPAALRALGRIRRWNGSVWFGQNARVLRPGIVRAGDPVHIPDTAPHPNP